MKPETPRQRHLRSVAELAAEYTKQGYRVLSPPSLEDTPAFLRPYLPDIIAVKNHEQWIVDVRTSGLPREEIDAKMDAWSLLSREANRAGWHFRIVVTKDEALSFTVPEAAEIEARLDDPSKLASEGHEGAALLLAWSVFEAAARRRLLRDEQDPMRPTTPGGLANSLVFYGYVDQPEELDALRDVIVLRNQVAHGLFAPKVPAEHLALLTTLARRLLADEEAPTGDVHVAKVA